MKYYLIIEPDEDGDPAGIVDEKRFQEILTERADHPPLTFKQYMEHSDPNYWEDRDWFACQVIPIAIQPVEVVTRLEVVAGGSPE